MRNLISSQRVADGLRIYGFVKFTIILLQLLPTLISEAKYIEITTFPDVTGYLKYIVSGLLEMLLFFALALALETIVEIGTIIRTHR